MVRERFPQVRLIVNEHNRGYASSNNLAIAKSRGRFVYLLNSDTEVSPGALDHLAAFLETHPEAGAAGSALYNSDGSVQASVKSLPTVRSAFFGKRSWLARWFPRFSATRSELLNWRVELGAPFEAGYVSSASIMIPRDVVMRVGDLDVRLWYFIDADYCRRIWDIGRSVHCVPCCKGPSRRTSRRDARRMETAIPLDVAVSLWGVHLLSKAFGAGRLAPCHCDRHSRYRGALRARDGGTSDQGAHGHRARGVRIV